MAFNITKHQFCHEEGRQLFYIRKKLDCGRLYSTEPFLFAVKDYQNYETAKSVFTICRRIASHGENYFIKRSTSEHITIEAPKISVRRFDLEERKNSFPLAVIFCQIRSIQSKSIPVDTWKNSATLTLFLTNKDVFN